MNSLLDSYKEQLGFKVISIPAKCEVERVQMYHVGLLKELAQSIMDLPAGQAIEVKFEALTSSNISTIHSTCKHHGFKFHCIRSGDKRILYGEKIS